jgi:hypothetical protein
MIILFLDGVIRLSGWASPSTTRCFCTDGRVLAVIRVSDNSRAQRTTFSCGRNGFISHAAKDLLAI